MDITFKEDGVSYEWHGNFGAIFVSRERNVKLGETRVIKNKLFYVYYTRRRKWYRKPEVNWTIMDVDHNKIAELRKLFLGCE